MTPLTRFLPLLLLSGALLVAARAEAAYQRVAGARRRGGGGQATAARRAPAADAVGRRLRPAGARAGPLRRHDAHADGACARRAADGRLRLCRGWCAYHLQASSSCPTSCARSTSRTTASSRCTCDTGHRWSDGAAVHRGGFPLLLGRRGDERQAVRRGAARSHARRRQAAALRGDRPESPSAIPGTAPIPEFLPALAGARPPFIYRPSHYLKRFHGRLRRPDRTRRHSRRSSACAAGPALHNKMDNLDKQRQPRPADLAALDA